MHASRRMWEAVDGAEARAQRIAWVVLASGALAVLALARAVTPHASGFGTHEQLGLPPCLFRAWTAFPCPGCGLTTSFAHLSRFDVSAAVHAHALGAPLYLLTVAVVPVSLLGAFRAWRFGAVWRDWRVGDLARAGACAFALAWAVRLVGLW